MKKIKVVDISSTDQGAYRLLRTRVKKINNDARFENYIICPRGEWAEKIKSLGIKHIPYDIDRKLNFMNIYSEIKKLERLILEVNPDIVHSHNSKSGAIARIAVDNINRKYYKSIIMVHQVHGYHFTKYKGMKRKAFLDIERYLAKKTDVLLFQNKYELNISIEEGMNRHCNLKYIGNGVNIKEINKGISKISDFKINNNKKIVCVARLESVKNHEMLIRSLGILKNKFNVSNFEAVFIGEGIKEKYFKLIENNCIKENIKFTGQLDRKKVIKHIASCDISVLTSIKEGRPRALIESLLIGKPCIGTNVVGTNEVIIDSENGYLVELGDEYNFAKSMYYLLTNESIYNEFSKNAKRYAIKEFNEDIIIERIKEVYLKYFS